MDAITVYLTSSTLFQHFLRCGKFALIKQTLWFNWGARMPLQFGIYLNQFHRKEVNEQTVGTHQLFMVWKKLLDWCCFYSILKMCPASNSVFFFFFTRWSLASMLQFIVLYVLSVQLMVYQAISVTDFNDSFVVCHMRLF